METKKQRTLAIFALAIALIATTVAYAALSTTLQVSGTVTKKGGTWNIYISKISNVTKTGDALITTNPTTISGKSTMKINFTATLAKPGDSVSFDFTVANSGSINAKINSPYYIGPRFIQSDGAAGGTYSDSESSKVLKDIICTLTYNGTKITSSNSSILSLDAAKNNVPTTKTIHMSCVYNETATTVSSENASMKFELSLPYIQA